MCHWCQTDVHIQLEKAHRLTAPPGVLKQYFYGRLSHGDLSICIQCDNEYHRLSKQKMCSCQVKHNGHKLLPLLI